jgi:Zn-dependent peptidase ImmA (M78 family)/predicted secreted protein
MASFRERQAAQLRGATAATREWMQLGLDASEQVDVFRVIEGARVWLLFEPLQHLYGFFQRAGDSAGVVLHNGHPLSLQRFTAAHEYGHFVLGHEASQDGHSELFGKADVPIQELEAQAFAAEFLMPLPLVNRAMDRLALRREPRELSPVEAYQLSLELGSSYTATITQLTQLNKISDHVLQELSGWQPITIKTTLGAGTRPGNARADVWDVTDSRRDRRLQLRLDDELHVRLPEVPTSGYRWAADLSGVDVGLDLLADELEPTDLHGQERFGATRQRHLWWRATGIGRGALDLRLVRSWQGADAAAVDRVSLAVAIEPPRTGTELDTGIALPQRRALLQAAA